MERGILEPTTKEEKAKERARSELWRHERQKKFKHLSTIGGLGAAGLAGYGAATKNKMLAIPAVGAAFLSGFAHGKAEQGEKDSYRKIKNFFNLQAKPQFNFGAVLPSEAPQEKTSWDLGSVMTLLGESSKLAPYYHQLPHWFQEMGPLGVSTLTSPYIVRKATKAIPSVMQSAAKEVMGKPLGGMESLMLDLGKGLGTIKSKAEKGNKLMAPLNYLLTPAMGMAVGANTGGIIGKGLKNVEKISPALAEKGLRAIVDSKEQKDLLTTAKNVGIASAAGLGSFQAGRFFGKRRQDKRPVSDEVAQKLMDEPFFQGFAKRADDPNSLNMQIGNPFHQRNAGPPKPPAPPPAAGNVAQGGGGFLNAVSGGLL